MALTVVLSVGLDPHLLDSRSLVLQSAGYLVVTADSIKQAVDRFEEGDFDLVLLCQSIAAKEKDRLTGWIRASGSGVPVVFVSGNLDPGDVTAGVTVGSDPQALLWGIREVLINAKAPEARTAAHRDQRGAATGKKSPASSTGYEHQTNAASGGMVPFARTGRTTS